MSLQYFYLKKIPIPLSQYLRGPFYSCLQLSRFYLILWLFPVLWCRWKRRGQSENSVGRCVGWRYVLPQNNNECNSCGFCMIAKTFVVISFFNQKKKTTKNRRDDVSLPQWIWTLTFPIFQIDCLDFVLVIIILNWWFGAFGWAMPFVSVYVQLSFLVRKCGLGNGSSFHSLTTARGSSSSFVVAPE